MLRRSPDLTVTPLPVKVRVGIPNVRASEVTVTVPPELVTRISPALPPAPSEAAFPGMTSLSTELPRASSGASGPSMLATLPMVLSSALRQPPGASARRASPARARHEDGAEK
jgi:hypothetical protein